MDELVGPSQIGGDPSHFSELRAPARGEVLRQRGEISERSRNSPPRRKVLYRARDQTTCQGDHRRGPPVFLRKLAKISVTPKSSMSRRKERRCAEKFSTAPKSSPMSRRSEETSRRFPPQAADVPRKRATFSESSPSVPSSRQSSPGSRELFHAHEKFSGARRRSPKARRALRKRAHASGGARWGERTR